jgi:Integral membrane protein CcmA involved in cell shape determination
MSNDLNDMRISGSGRMSGGSYNDVRISGWGEVAGDIDCNDFSISGSGNVTGALKANDATISGSGRIDGGVDCAQRLKISGSAKIGGSVKCGTLTVSGDSHIEKDVRAEKIRISGSTKIGGNCSAEEFKTDGSFAIGGLLNAGSIELRLHAWGSSAQEIGGEAISVSRHMHGWLTKFFGGKYLLETGTIEGDEINLEGVKASVVRGRNIRIGEGCDIGLVEYSGTFEQDSGASVKTNRKI